MEDYKWLGFARQKASEYQAAAERHSLIKLCRVTKANSRMGFRRQLVKVLLGFANALSPDVVTNAETGKRELR